MRKRVWISLVLAVGAVLVILLASQIMQLDLDAVKVGAILPLTGPAAAFGKSSQNAITLATDDLKTLYPQTKLRVFYEDSVADPKTAITAFERLYRLRKCQIFLSSVSGVTLALAPAIKRNDLVLFANAAHPDVTKDGGNVFRYSNTVDSEAVTIADFLPGIGAKRVFCLASGDDYGKAYTAELHRLASAPSRDFDIVGNEFYGRGTIDFRTVLAKALTLKPDLFVIIGLGHTQGLAIRQLREIGFTGPFIASLGFIVTSDAIEVAGETVRGGYFLNYVALSDPRVQRLRERYAQEFGEVPSPTIILDYSIMFILSDCLKTSDGSLSSLKDQLQKKRSFETPVGTLTNLGTGDIIAPVHIQKVPSTGPVNLWSSQ